MSDLSVLNTSLTSMIALPDDQAAPALHMRMVALDTVERIQQVSFSERGFIIREFKLRSLWKYLTDPDTGEVFPTMNAWMSCTTFLGCRRTNYEALRIMGLLEDVPAAKLIDIPKSNLHTLTQLSTAVRNQPDVLEAARTMPREAFEEKVEFEHPLQHVETRSPMRLTPGRSERKILDAAIRWAIDHDIAGNPTEAIVRACETALNAWHLDDELAHMPIEEQKEKE